MNTKSLVSSTAVTAAVVVLTGTGVAAPAVAQIPAPVGSPGSVASAAAPEDFGVTLAHLKADRPRATGWASTAPTLVFEQRLVWLKLR